MIKKLCMYQYDCVRQAIKSSSFNNLKSNKDNKILIVENEIFEADNVEIVDIMTSYELNKNTMNLLYSEIFIKSDKLYSPLLYYNIELKRNGNKILMEKEENPILNYGAIAILCDGAEEKIENIFEQLTEVDEINLPTVMKSLINVEFIEQKAVILAVLPNSTAGLLNELKEIAKRNK